MTIDRAVRSQALCHLAQIETMLMVEFLASKDIRPECEECKWITNVPAGPDSESIAKLTALVMLFGEENVATGNANPPTSRMVGLYLRHGAREI